MMAIQHHPSEVMYSRAMDHFAYEAILGRKGVVAWDGAHILDWYLGQRG